MSTVDEAKSVHEAISGLVDVYARQLSAMSTEIAALRAKLALATKPEQASLPQDIPEGSIVRSAIVGWLRSPEASKAVYVRMKDGDRGETYAQAAANALADAVSNLDIASRT